MPKRAKENADMPVFYFKKAIREMNESECSVFELPPCGDEDVKNIWSYGTNISLNAPLATRDRSDLRFRFFLEIAGLRELGGGKPSGLQGFLRA